MTGTGKRTADGWEAASDRLSGSGEASGREGDVPSCPACGQPARITEWDRPPRETTWDRMGQGIVGSWRTWEPGPEATVTLSCGDQIDGPQGLAVLEAAARIAKGDNR